MSKKQADTVPGANRPRVFCVGWHKTGTSTVGHALIQLGYKVLGCRLDTVEDLSKGDIESVLALTDEFDALQDVPWAFLFRELDHRYPGSKFILTDRDENAWLKSAKTHFGARSFPMHKVMYGEAILQGNEAVYLERFRNHNSKVRSYFKNRGSDFLELNFAEGDGWAKLCSFLGKPPPNRPFPHANKGTHSLNSTEALGNKLRNVTPRLFRRMFLEMRLFFLGQTSRQKYLDPFHNRAENRRSRKSER